MDGIIPELAGRAKRRLRQQARQCKDAKLRTRYLIILNLADGRSPTQTHRVLNVARSTVYRVAARFRWGGAAGLLDRREDNGSCKLDEWYLGILNGIVADDPQTHGWRRPTWTRAMLAETMRQWTGVRVAVNTMSRALRQIGARRGRPRPTVRCPWSPQAKGRRLARIRRLLAALPPDEVAVYEDEVDIHLNPKIGLDWMVRGQQKVVVTPGTNVKRYVAGAMDARSGEVTWVEGDRKNSDLFVALLWRLQAAYPRAKRIHVILDNYRIHSSRIARQALAALAGRIELHFLPPYCPEANRIERMWLDLHAAVTRNHHCVTIEQLMRHVRSFLRRRQRKTTIRHNARRNTRPVRKAG